MCLNLRGMAKKVGLLAGANLWHAPDLRSWLPSELTIASLISTKSNSWRSFCTSRSILSCPMPAAAIVSPMSNTLPVTALSTSRTVSITTGRYRAGRESRSSSALSGAAATSPPAPSRRPASCAGLGGLACTGSKVCLDAKRGSLARMVSGASGLRMTTTGTLPAALTASTVRAMALTRCAGWTAPRPHASALPTTSMPALRAAMPTSRTAPSCRETAGDPCHRKAVVVASMLLLAAA